MKSLLMYFQQEKEELSSIESRISSLKSDIDAVRQRQKSLEDGLGEFDTEVVSGVRRSNDMSIDNNLTMRIYAENRRQAQQQHCKMTASHGSMPLYNQPADISHIQDIRAKFNNGFKQKLVSIIKMKLRRQTKLEADLAKQHDEMQEQWLRAVDEFENDPKKKAKREKTREYFEKIFPELRKQREEKERGQRLGTRNVTSTGFAKSDVDIDQILDNLHEKEEEEKRIRTAACIVPTMLWTEDRSKLLNRNGYVKDPNSLFQHFQMASRSKWTEKDRALFREKFAQRYKDFFAIATAFPDKTVADCVHFFYATKHQGGYKALGKLQRNRSRPKAKAMMRVQTANQAELEPLQPRRGGNNGQNERTKVKDIDEDTVASASEQPDSEEESAESHECHSCGIKLESYSYSRAVDAARSELFGIKPSESAAGEINSEKAKTSTVSAVLTVDNANPRVCHSCWSNVVNSKFFQCPLPSCRTPKRRLARLKVLPSKWPRLAVDVRENIINEFGISSSGSSQCCPTCFQRIRKRISAAMSDSNLGSNGDDSETGQSRKMRRKTDTNASEFNDKLWLTAAAEDSQWSSEEVEDLKTALYNNGRNWAAVSEAVGTRTTSECKNFYFRRKCDLRLDRLVDLKRKIKARVANQEKAEKAAAAAAAAAAEAAAAAAISYERSKISKDETLVDQNNVEEKTEESQDTIPKETSNSNEENVQPPSTSNEAGAEMSCKKPEVSVIVKVESQVAQDLAPDSSESQTPVYEEQALLSVDSQNKIDKVSPKHNSSDDLAERDAEKDSQQKDSSSQVTVPQPISTIRDFLAEEIEKQLSTEQQSPDLSKLLTKGVISQSSSSLPCGVETRPTTPPLPHQNVQSHSNIPMETSSSIISQSSKPPEIVIKQEEIAEFPAVMKEQKKSAQHISLLPSTPSTSKPGFVPSILSPQESRPRLNTPMGSITHGTPLSTDGPPAIKPPLSQSTTLANEIRPQSTNVAQQNMVKDSPKSAQKSVIMSPAVLERKEKDFQSHPQKTEEKPQPQALTVQRGSRSLSSSAESTQAPSLLKTAAHIVSATPPPQAPSSEPAGSQKQQSNTVSALTTQNLMEQLIAQNLGGNPSPQSQPQSQTLRQSNSVPAHSQLLQFINRAARSPGVDMLSSLPSKSTSYGQSALTQQQAKQQPVAPSPPPLASQKMNSLGYRPTELAALKQIQLLQQQQKQNAKQNQNQRSFSLSNVASASASGPPSTVTTSLSASITIPTVSTSANSAATSNAPKLFNSSAPAPPQPAHTAVSAGGVMFEPISPASSPSSSPQPAGSNVTAPPPSQSIGPANTSDLFTPASQQISGASSGFAMPVPLPMGVPPLASPSTMSPDLLHHQILQIQYAAVQLAAQMATKTSRSQTPAASSNSAQSSQPTQQPQLQMPPTPHSLGSWNLPQPASSPHPQQQQQQQSTPLLGLPGYAPAPSPMAPGTPGPLHLHGTSPGPMFLPGLAPQLGAPVSNSGASTPSSSSVSQSHGSNQLAAAMNAMNQLQQHQQGSPMEIPVPTPRPPFMFHTPQGVFQLPPMFQPPK